MPQRRDQRFHPLQPIRRRGGGKAFGSDRIQPIFQLSGLNHRDRAGMACKQSRWIPRTTCRNLRTIHGISLHSKACRSGWQSKGAIAPTQPILCRHALACANIGCNRFALRSVHALRCIRSTKVSVWWISYCPGEIHCRSYSCIPFKHFWFGWELLATGTNDKARLGIRPLQGEAGDQAG